MRLIIPLAAAAMACSGAGRDPVDRGDDDDGGRDTGASPEAPAGFAIGGVESLNTQLSFVADAVQLSSGAVVAVGQDFEGRGAVHRVTPDDVTVLHAGLPLGQPVGVDVDGDDAIFVADAGGAGEELAELTPTGEAPTLPYGALFSMSSTPGAPTLVTDDVVSPQSVVAAAGGVLYATGFTVDREPAVFSVDGAAATVLASGAPLVRPGDLSVVGDPDATQLWIIDVSAGQNGVDHGGASLLAVIPPSPEVIEVHDGMTAIGVTGRGPDALVTTRDPDGSSRIQIVDVTDGSRRDVDAASPKTPATATGAGAGADPSRPVWAGGHSGLVYVTLPAATP